MKKKGYGKIEAWLSVSAHDKHESKMAAAIQKISKQGPRTGMKKKELNW